MLVEILHYNNECNYCAGETLLFQLLIITITLKGFGIEIKQIIEFCCITHQQLLNQIGPQLLVGYQRVQYWALCSGATFRTAQGARSPVPGFNW